jgi:Rieske Fe-S protein
MNEENSRREFFKKSLATVGVVLCGSALAALMESCEHTASPIISSQTFAELDVTQYPPLLQSWGAIKKLYPGQDYDMPLIIIRHSNLNPQFVVFSSKCGHQGFEVGLPTDPTANIICPLHGSQYSQFDASVQLGPTTVALQVFTSSFDASKNVLTIYFR